MFGRLAGDVDGWGLVVVVLLLRGGMEFEVGGLGGLEFGGVFAEVADGFEGYFAGDAVGGVVGRGLEGGGPAVGGVDDLGQDFAQVDVAGAVVVEVVGELVGDGGELLDEVVGILLAAGAAGMGVEVLNLVDAEVEEFDEEEDAGFGVVAGVADLVDLGLGEGVVVLDLGVERWGQREGENEGCCDAGSDGSGGHEGVPQGLKPFPLRGWEKPSVKAWGPWRQVRWGVGLVGEDLGQELVVDLVELLEGVLDGVAIGAGDEVEDLREAVAGAVHELLGVLDALGVAGEVDVDEVSVEVDLFESGRGLLGVAGGNLLASLLGHGVDELSVEEALLAGIGLAGALLELGEDVRAGDDFVCGKCAEG
jgi:hypothetical protein